MFGRAREPERRERSLAPRAPQPAAFGGLGNQAMIRLLRPALAREPAPSRLRTGPITELPAGEYAETLRGGGSVIPLYAELAKLLDVSKLEGFSGEINRALRPDPADLKPGLNFVARLGDRGQTGYLLDGEFTGKLPTTRTGSEPKVAILLGPGAFDPGNKAAALGVLRHEMEHAFHDQLAAKALKRWREDTGAEKTPFAGWLEKQSMSAVDRALIRRGARAPGRFHRRLPGRGERRQGGRAPRLRERAQGGRRPLGGLRQGRAGGVHHAPEGVEDAADGRAPRHPGRRPQGPQGGRQVLRAAGRRRPRLTARRLVGRTPTTGNG
jgi:hypothetical protein